MGLVRFVHPSHGGRTIRYRHVADERWHLSPAELGVLAVLVLRGAADRRRGARPRRAAPRATRTTGTVEEILDTLAARSPDPFAVRLERRPGEREARWAHALSGEPDSSVEDPPTPDGTTSTGGDGGRPRAATPTSPATSPSCGSRVERLERLLGLERGRSARRVAAVARSPVARRSTSSSDRLFMQ